MEAERRRRLRRPVPALALVAALLAACAVGPDFEPPEAPAPERYTDGPVLDDAGDAAADSDAAVPQRLLPGEDLPARWWALFEQPALDALVERTLAGSPTLPLARANLAQAREALVAARGAFFPALDVGFTAERARTPGLRSGSSSSTSDFYSVGPSAAYVVDVFGGIRRGVEAQSAYAEARRYELAAAWLTLTGNAVGQALSIASLEAQIEAIEGVIEVDAQNLDLVRRRFEAGRAPRADVLVAQTQLAGDQTLLPPLLRQLALARHALTALVGEVPAEWSPPPLVLDDFAVPQALPLSLPSQLVRQRPDVLAAEAELHAASALIGVATAQLFPSLTLSGSIAETALELGSLFGSGGGTAWSAAGRIGAPLFRGGALRAQRRAAIAAYDASLASWRLTVLEGFRQVADSLRALEYDGALLDASTRLVDTAAESLRLQQASYAAGRASLLQMLTAARAHQQARSRLALARGEQLQDTVQLFVALGGGWWQAEPPAR